MSWGSGRTGSSPQPTPRHVAIAAITLLALRSAVADPIDPQTGHHLAPWHVQERTLSQHNDPKPCWQVDYLLVLDPAASPTFLTSDTVSAHLESWVSNASVPGHHVPRTSQLNFLGEWPTRAEFEILASPDLSGRCRELGVLDLWVDDTNLAGVSPAPRLAARVATQGLNGLIPLRVAPGDQLHVRLQLEHDHFLYDPYEPLFGVRSFQLVLGSAQLRDELKFDRSVAVRSPAPSWQPPDPPIDRQDRQVFLTPPHSLRLSAEQPGGASYRLSGNVRYDTLMKLSFWYLLSEEGSATGLVRISQLKQGPALWKPLGAGAKEIGMTREGRWTKVEQVLRTEAEATHLIVEFRVIGATGTLWIDDVQMETLGRLASREP
jgi:hypothetical protein